MSCKIKINKGEIFTNLEIIEEVEPFKWVSKNGKNRSKRVFKCKCVCGDIVKVSIDHLRSGHTKSCRCEQPKIAQKVNKTHGKYITPLGSHDHHMLNVWKALVQRCTTNKNYTRLTHSVRLLTDFEYFCDYIDSALGARHSDMTLDRVNNNLGYIEGNLRWATRDQQANNTRGKARRSSKFKGVCYHKNNGKWTAQIRKNGKSHYIGSFSQEYDAAIAYVIEWAKLNLKTEELNRVDIEKLIDYFKNES